MDTLYYRVWTIVASSAVVLDDDQCEPPLMADMQAAVALFATYDEALRYAEAERAMLGCELSIHTIPF